MYKPSQEYVQIRCVHRIGRTIIYILAFVAIVANSLALQMDTLRENPRFGFGGFGGYQRIIPDADFRAFPGIPTCCPSYGSGHGNGILGGLQVDIPLSTSLRLLVRGGFSSAIVNLTRNEDVVVSGNQAGVFQHRVDASLQDVFLEPMISYEAVSSVWLLGGFQSSFASRRVFSQVEQIMLPLDGVFPDGSSTRNEIDNAEIPQATALTFSMGVGIRTELPLNRNRTFSIQPEIVGLYGLNNLVSATAWTNIGIRAGLVLAWMPENLRTFYRTDSIVNVDTVVRDSYTITSQESVHGAEVRTIDISKSDTLEVTSITVVRTDTIFIPKGYPADIALDVTGQSQDGTKQPFIQRARSIRQGQLLAPVLPFMFFAEGRSDLVDSYRKQRGDSAYSSTNDVYYDLLRIVANRMKEHPDAILQITGCNSQEGVELDNLVLSEARAREVQKYLVQRFAIDPSRLRIVTRGLPTQAARVGRPNGNAENRRVELQSDNVHILSAVELSRNDDHDSATVSFAINGSSVDSVKSWILTGHAGSTIVDRDSGVGKPATSMKHVLHGTALRSDMLEYQLVTRDAASRSTTVTKSIQVRKAIVPTHLQEYPVVMFGIGSSDVQQEQLRLIENIKSQITPSDIVTVTGFADNVGSYKNNLLLAESRANNVARLLNIDKASGHVSGVVMTEDQNETTPEQRSLSRLVTIVVEKRGGR